MHMNKQTLTIPSPLNNYGGKGLSDGMIHSLSTGSVESRNPLYGEHIIE